MNYQDRKDREYLSFVMGDILAAQEERIKVFRKDGYKVLETISEILAREIWRLNQGMPTSERNTIIKQEIVDRKIKELLIKLDAFVEREDVISPALNVLKKDIETSCQRRYDDLQRIIEMDTDDRQRKEGASKFHQMRMAMKAALKK